MFWCGHHIECAICGVANIPDIDWPWVKDGRHVHAQCLHKVGGGVIADGLFVSEIHADEAGGGDTGLGAAGRGIIAVIENAVGRRVTEHLGPDIVQTCPLSHVEVVNAVDGLHDPKLDGAAVMLAESVGIDLKE